MEILLDNTLFQIDKFFDRDPSLSPCARYAVDRINDLWSVALEWVRKSHNKSYRMQGNRKLAQLAKPLGDVLSAILRLCNYFYSFHPSGKQHYTSGLDWFRLIATELYRKSVCEVRKLEGFETKQETYNANRQFIKLLFDTSEPKNPCSKLVAPHSWRFCQAGIDLYEGKQTEELHPLWRGSKNASKKGFRDALLAFNAHYKQEACKHRFVDDRIEYHPGRGNGWIRINF